MKENETNTDATHGISIRVVGGIVTVIAVLLSLFAFTLASQVGSMQESLTNAEKQYVKCSEAINDLQKASDYLTTQARSFVVTGRREFLDAYMNELEVADRRGKAVEVLRASFSADDEAAKDLEQALAASDALAQTEFVAMKIAAEQHGVKDLPKKVQDANVNLYKREGDNRDAQEVATNLVLNETYEEAKREIRAKVEESSTGLLTALENELDHSEATVQSLLFQLRISVALLLCAIMVLVLTLFMYVLKPLGQYVARIKKKEPLKADGAYELHYLANAYNVMYEDNAKRIEQLRAFAERDPLTGISNRSGYDNFLATHTRNIVLLLMDIDNFGDYNAVYGHETGDAVLIRLAKALGEAFRSTDFPCRIESDTFAVIMTNVSMDVRDVIVSKVELVNTMLAEDSDELPLVTLSVGAAFSTEGMTDKEIYRAANDALMDAKKSESNSIVFYGENNSVR
jgi:diguanylate cyclase (GGDEF)-like protein